MINANKLRGRVVENGLTMRALAARLGVNESTLHRKLQNSGFTIHEAQEIAKILNLSAEDVMAIFLPNYVGGGYRRSEHHPDARAEG
jgi:transcriptional regulator with XRE-family HTH domain